MQSIQLVGPSRPWRIEERSSKKRRGSLHALEALSRIDAVLERTRTQTGCPYCAPGAGYVIPDDGCPCSRQVTLEDCCESNNSRRDDEYLEMRRAIMENGLEYSYGGTILSVR
jgi:hypothetical protein